MSVLLGWNCGRGVEPVRYGLLRNYPWVRFQLPDDVLSAGSEGAQILNPCTCAPSARLTQRRPGYILR